MGRQRQQHVLSDKAFQSSWELPFHMAEAKPLSTPHYLETKRLPRKERMHLTVMTQLKYTDEQIKLDTISPGPRRRSRIRRSEDACPTRP